MTDPVSLNNLAPIGTNNPEINLRFYRTSSTLEITYIWGLAYDGVSPSIKETENPNQKQR